jgi:hypothetical protein
MALVQFETELLKHSFLPIGAQTSRLVVLNNVPEPLWPAFLHPFVDGPIPNLGSNCCARHIPRSSQGIIRYLFH